MTKDGKTYHAKLADHGGYIGKYVGDMRGIGSDRIPVYRFEGGEAHSFDADDRFDSVPNNEWVEAFWHRHERRDVL